MVKQDVIDCMMGKIHIFTFFHKYLVHHGHDSNRVTTLVGMLQQCINQDFVNNLMIFTMIKARNEFEITILMDKNNQPIIIF